MCMRTNKALAHEGGIASLLPKCFYVYTTFEKPIHIICFGVMGYSNAILGVTGITPWYSYATLGNVVYNRVYQAKQPGIPREMW